MFYLHLFLPWHSCFLYADLNFWSISCSFSLKHFFQSFLQSKSAGDEFPQFLSEKVFISPSHFKDNFAVYKTLLRWVFFFQLYSTQFSSCLHGFLSLFILLHITVLHILVPYKQCCFPLASFKVFSFSLVFCSLNKIVFLGVVFLVFILLGILWDSWTCSFCVYH